MNIIQQPSPNFDNREGQSIDMLVLHYTGMKSGKAALDRLCDESAKVSAHYMIDVDGTIFQLVDEQNRAWHAGVSYWRGNNNINQRSIGIEIVNMGHEFGYTPFPKIQMKAVVELCKIILTRHAIPPRNVVAHSDIAPTRKKDPGELFDWKFLAENGIGLFPDVLSLQGGEADVAIQNYKSIKETGLLRDARNDEHFGSYLNQYGYDTTDLTQAIIAFQRHFRPNNISGIWDNECGVLLADLLAMI